MSERIEQNKEETAYFVNTPAKNIEKTTNSFVINRDQAEKNHQVSIHNENGLVCFNEKNACDEESTQIGGKHNMETVENEVSIMEEGNSVKEKSVVEDKTSNVTNSSLGNDEISVLHNPKPDAKNDIEKKSSSRRKRTPKKFENTPENQIALSLIENDISCFNPDDKLTCPYCGKKFTRISGKSRHIRVIHKIKKEIGSYIRCIECNITFQQVQKLREHLQDKHKLNMKEEKFHFSNMNAFKKWKHDTERKEITYFVSRNTAKRTTKSTRYVYVCHRSGKQVCVEGPRQRMIKAAGTCKLGIMCTAAIYCEEYPCEVIVKYYPHHYGHGKETSFIQLSTQEQTAIQETISNGISFETLLDDIRDDSTADHFQLFLLKKRDLRFINSAFNADEYNPGISDLESVDHWVRTCSQMEESPVLFYQQEDPVDSEEIFILIIMTEFQKQILLSSDKQVVCVDSLHRRKGGRFYLTVFFIMDEYEFAFPVAFCISNKVDKAVITQFFTSIKESTGPLECTYFMSDSENIYYEAWTDVMSKDSKWLWSMWYVDHRIRMQLRIFKGNTEKRAEAYKTMRKLLECQNQNVFHSMFKNYVDALIKDPQSKNLGVFIMQKYGNNAKMWAHCYRRDIKLSTNLHLEVMHRTFLYCCREGRKKRLDKFIFVIMKLVRYKMLDRLSNAVDEEKISLAVKAIEMFHGMGLEIPTDHISSLSDKIWLIRSDEEEENIYITQEFETCPEHCNLKCVECDICVHMYSCSCLHSLINANLCQHIHAIVWKFITPHFSPPPSPVADNCENMDVLSTEMPSKNSELLDSVLKKMHHAYKEVRANKCNLNTESLTAIMKRIDECIDICSGKGEPSMKQPATNPLYVVNPFVKNNNAQPLLLPANLQSILPNSKLPSNFLLVLPK